MVEFIKNAAGNGERYRVKLFMGLSGIYEREKFLISLVHQIIAILSTKFGNRVIGRFLPLTVQCCANSLYTIHKLVFNSPPNLWNRTRNRQQGLEQLD